MMIHEKLRSSGKKRVLVEVRKFDIDELRKSAKTESSDLALNFVEVNFPQHPPHTADDDFIEMKKRQQVPKPEPQIFRESVDQRDCADRSGFGELPDVRKTDSIRIVKFGQDAKFLDAGPENRFSNVVFQAAFISANAVDAFFSDGEVTELRPHSGCAIDEVPVLNEARADAFVDIDVDKVMRIAAERVFRVGKTAGVVEKSDGIFIAQFLAECVDELVRVTEREDDRYDFFALPVNNSRNNDAYAIDAPFWRNGLNDFFRLVDDEKRRCGAAFERYFMERFDVIGAGNQRELDNPCAQVANEDSVFFRIDG